MGTRKKKSSNLLQAYAGPCEPTPTRTYANLRERCERLKVPPPRLGNPVERPNPPFLTVDQAGIAQPLQVMANGGLVLLKLIGDIANTEWLRLLRQQIKHPQPRGIGEDLQSGGECRRPSARQTRSPCRRAARLVLVPVRQWSQINLWLWLGTCTLFAGAHARIVANQSMFVNGCLSMDVCDGADRCRCSVRLQPHEVLVSGASPAEHGMPASDLRAISIPTIPPD